MNGAGSSDCVSFLQADISSSITALGQKRPSAGLQPQNLIVQKRKTKDSSELRTFFTLLNIRSQLISYH